MILQRKLYKTMRIEVFRFCGGAAGVFIKSRHDNATYGNYGIVGRRHHPIMSREPTPVHSGRICNTSHVQIMPYLDTRTPMMHAANRAYSFETQVV